MRENYLINVEEVISFNNIISGYVVFLRKEVNGVWEVLDFSKEYDCMENLLIDFVCSVDRESSLLCDWCDEYEIDSRFDNLDIRLDFKI